MVRHVEKLSLQIALGSREIHIRDLGSYDVICGLCCRLCKLLPVVVKGTNKSPAQPT
jgi:hypothetical protein